MAPAAVREGSPPAARASYMTRFGYSHTWIVIVDEFFPNYLFQYFFATYTLGKGRIESILQLYGQNMSHHSDHTSIEKRGTSYAAEIHRIPFAVALSHL